MKIRIRVFFLVFISFSFMFGCISVHGSSFPQSTQQITSMNMPTPTQGRESNGDILQSSSDHLNSSSGTKVEDCFVGEWLGRTYSIISSPPPGRTGPYKLDYSDSIEMKMTIHDDGSGWLTIIPFSDTRADVSSLIGTGAKLTVVDTNNNFITLRWNGWVYNGLATTALPEAGEIRVGYYTRGGLNEPSPIWETDVNWSAYYTPDYVLVGDIVSSDGQFLHRITFDDFKKCTYTPGEPYLYKSVMDEELPDGVDGSIATDGKMHLVSSAGYPKYQYLQYIDLENQEHVCKFRPGQDECMLIEIDGDVLLMEPVAFSYSKDVFIYYYWANLMVLDRSTGMLEYVSAQYPFFYKETFASLYRLSDKELTDGWEKTYAGVETAISKAYVFLLEQLFAGDFSGTTSDEIADYLKDNYSGPMPDWHDPEYYNK